MRLIGLSALGVTLLAAPAATQGFGVNEHGTCMMGRGGAGIAAPCNDGSGMFFNPAGIVGGRGLTVSLGVTGIKAVGGFTADFTGAQDDLLNPLIPVPHLYLTYGLNDRMTAGLGVFVPYGLGTRWLDAELDEPAAGTFEGRFNGYDNDLSTIYIQPTFAVRPHPMISIGGGPDILFGRIKLTQRIDLSEAPVPSASVPAGTTFGNLGIPFHTEFATGVLEGHGTGFGGHVGILVEPHPRVAFGARYMLQATVDYDGTVEFTQVPTNIVLPAPNPLSAGPVPLDVVLGAAFEAGAPLADGAVAASITMPAQFAAGVAVRPNDDLLLMVDYQMVRWSVFDTLRGDFANPATPDIVLPESFEDTHGLRAGLEWRTSTALAVRAGFIWHTAAAPDQTVTPLLPEGERNEVAFGLGYQVSRTIMADVSYQFLRQGKRRGRVQEEPINTGLYEFNAHLIGLTLTARF